MKDIVVRSMRESWQYRDTKEYEKVANKIQWDIEQSGVDNLYGSPEFLAPEKELAEKYGIDEETLGKALYILLQREVIEINSKIINSDKGKQCPKYRSHERYEAEATRKWDLHMERYRYVGIPWYSPKETYRRALDSIREKIVKKAKGFTEEMPNPFSIATEYRVMPWQINSIYEHLVGRTFIDETGNIVIEEGLLKHGEPRVETDAKDNRISHRTYVVNKDPQGITEESRNTLLEIFEGMRELETAQKAGSTLTVQDWRDSMSETI